VIDLFDLVEPLKREVNPPGSDLFPNATDDSYLGSLTDAFWEVRLYGFLEGFEENVAARGGPAEFSEGKITPTGAVVGYDLPDDYSPDDLGRDLQQLVVLWAGWKIVLTRMSSINSVFRAKAGPVEYETQTAASVLKSVLDTLKSRIDYVLENIGTAGGSSVAILDSVMEATYSVAAGSYYWVR
jgi:hypothetical protein